MVYGPQVMLMAPPTVEEVFAADGDAWDADDLAKTLGEHLRIVTRRYSQPRPDPFQTEDPHHVTSDRFSDVRGVKEYRWLLCR